MDSNSWEILDAEINAESDSHNVKNHQQQQQRYGQNVKNYE